MTSESCALRACSPDATHSEKIFHSTAVTTTCSTITATTSTASVTMVTVTSSECYRCDQVNVCAVGSHRIFLSSTMTSQRKHVFNWPLREEESGLSQVYEPDSNLPPAGPDAPLHSARLLASCSECVLYRI